MNGLSKIPHPSKLIYRIDYRRCTVTEMLCLLDQLDEELAAHNHAFSLLSCFDNETYATATFMRKAEQITKKYLHRMEKQAIAGHLSLSKKVILQGYNLMFNRQFPAFEAEEEALTFLLRQ